MLRVEVEPLADLDLSAVVSLARWETAPSVVEGRSALTDHPVDSTQVLRAKGIAWTDRHGAVRPPSPDSWFSDGRERWLACEVSPEGRITGRPTEDRAVGAMPLARVDAEIDATARLAAAGVDVSTVVGRGRYLGWEFGGEPLGFLVLSEPRGLRRLGAQVDARGLDAPETARDLRDAGALLHGIHRAGLVDISPHLGNMSRVGSRMRAHDLDRWRDSQALTPDQQWAYRVRDTAILGWSLARRTYQQGHASLRHALAREVMAGYVGDDRAVAYIPAVELIRFVGMLRSGGFIHDLEGTWPRLVRERMDA